MDSPLVVVFLVVIAVTALLQAGFVGGLVFGARMGSRRMAAVEEAFDTTVVPRIRQARSVTDKAAKAAHTSLIQAHRVDQLVAEASRKAERSLDRAATRVEGAVERAAERVEAQVSRRADGARRHPVLRRLSTASALVAGLQRALEVWQEGDGGAGGDVEVGGNGNAES